MPRIPTPLRWCLNTGVSLGDTPLGSTSFARPRRPRAPSPKFGDGPAPSGLVGAVPLATVTSSDPSELYESILPLGFGVHAIMNTPANVAAQP